MKISCIFEKYLYASVYPRDYKVVWTPEMCEYFDEEEVLINEMRRLFELWTNPYYLMNYFKNNESFLESHYWRSKNFSIEDLSKITKEKAIQFEDFLFKNAKLLDCCFQPLNDNHTKIQNISESKYKKSWLRIYAIKVNANKYLITGGAIKLTKKMRDHPETEKELIKLEKNRIFLQSNGVFDSESYEDLLYELRI